MNAAGAAGLICRDCLARESPGARRCQRCGSPRLLDLESAAGLTIAHVDCDAFYAAVEKRDRPEFRDVPLVVGGTGKRGVVSTACYLARASGVKSAMPMAEARRLCPEAVILPPRMEAYLVAGRRVRELMQEMTPSVEPLSIDEAFLDLAGCERALGASAAEALVQFACRVEADVGVTVSIGLAPNKFLAKLASDWEKPRGFTVLPASRVLQALAPIDVGRIWGVGEVARSRLIAAGLRTIGDVQRLTEDETAARIGDGGRRIWRLARGIDDRSVAPRRKAKGISAETTFEDDLSGYEALAPHLLAQSERVAARLAREGLSVRTVTLKLRRRNFQLVSRTRSLASAVSLAPEFAAVLAPILKDLAATGSFRLLGVGVADFVEREERAPSTLFAEADARLRSREAAIASIRHKFGRGALVRGPLFKGRA